jgi:hypothetical protein
MRRVLTSLLAATLATSAATAWAFWSAGSATGGYGAAAGSSVDQGATPTASAVAQAVTVSWAASMLSNGQAVTGYQVKRYDANTMAPQTILASCDGTVAGTTCVESNVAAGSWQYSVTPLFATNWLGAESAKSTTVTVAPPDSTPPTNTISLSTITGGAFKSGNTVYYRGTAAGSFRLTNAVSDAGSGPASSATAVLGGTTTGWSHTPSTVSTPSGGPYVSNVFSWTAATTTGPTEVVTGRDVAGNSAQTTLTFINDITAPTSGTITYANGYQPGLSVPVTFTTGTDSGAGIATRRLQRKSAPLIAGTCGTYTLFANLGTVNPTSIYTDTAVSNGKCYMYQYVVTDNVGNSRTTTSASVSKIDDAAAVSATPGLYSYWRLGEALASTPMDDLTTTNNNGTYGASPTMGVAGAIAGDTNTAVQFDGQWPAYATAARQLGGDFSFEFWFKSTQDFSNDLGQPHCTYWWQGAGLIDADVSGPANDFGISLCSGKVIAGVGGATDVSIVTSGTYNNGAWHHVVFTRTQVSGAIALYVDGSLAGTATGDTNTLDSHPTLNFGRSAAGVNYFAGALDEVILYNTALSGSTINNHYRLGTSDAAGPIGGSVDATGLVGTGSRYAASTTLSLSLAKGTDPSGVATTGNQLLRASASLTNGTCGTFGSYTLVSGGTDPISPKSDAVTDQFCYSYQYVVLDALGNSTTYTSAAIKVDRTAPAAPSLAYTGFTNSYWSGTGTTIFYRSAATSGSFVATATATDAASGIASYTFPALGTNWTSTPGALGVNTYSWSGAPAAPGTKNVTATNNANITSANAPFTMTADNTSPTVGTVSYVNGDTMGTSVTVTFTAGTDSGSGIGTRLLQRASATRTNGTCGAFGSFTTVTNGTNPTSPLVDSVAIGNCYKYQYFVADNVGNTRTTSSASVATSPTGGYWAFDDGSGTTAVDSSGNANTGTLQAGAGWTAGRVGPFALNLTGATNSFAAVTPPVIDSSQTYSVAAWVRPNNLTGFQTIVSIDGATISPFYLQMSDGVLQFSARGSDSTGSTITTVTGGTATQGVWTHLVAVHDNVANTISLYKNGVLQSSTAFNSPWAATGNLVIGRAKWGGAPVDFLNGAIDEVHIYDRALTTTEISNLAAQ